MHRLRVPRSYRSRLFFGLGITILLTLGFGFYVFFKSNQLIALVQSGELLTSSNQLKFVGDLEKLAQIAFYFFSINLLVITALLIYLSFSLETYLRLILSGIRRVNTGDLSHRITLRANNEFGMLANFINQATAHVESMVNERTKQLSAERNKLAITLSGITDGVIALDTKRLIIAINKNALSLVGVNNEQDALGKPIDTLFKLYDDKNNEIIPSVYAPIKANTEGVVYTQPTTTLINNQQSKLFVTITTSQIKEGPSFNFGCILTIHDLTESRDLEEMKLDFVSMAAHELRTPLSSAMGYLQLIKTEGGKPNPEYIERALSSTKNLVGLIDKLLSVAHIENSKLALSFEKLNINSLIDEAVRDQSLSAKKAGLNINIDISTKPVYVIGDSLRLREVIDNLLSNAIRFTPKGGQIAVKIAQNKNKIITTVADTGVGIAKADLSKLFSKFYRVDSGLSSSSRGTGLGLFISKSIIKLHNGTIKAASVSGKGTTFTFTLPNFDEAKYRNLKK
jgi:two-component system sensor histidine kinase VicK